MTLLTRARDSLKAFAELVGRDLTEWQAGALILVARVTVVVAPRQTGKSRSLAVLAVHRAFRHRDYRVLIISAGEVGARRLLDEVRAVIHGAPGLSVSVVDETAGFVRLSNGSEIRCVPASEAQIRGWSVDLLIVDEAALVGDELLYGAALPTTMARPDARIVLASSPKGQSGAFYEHAMRGLAGTDPSVATFRWKLADASWVTAEALASLRAGLPPELQRAEIDGEFVDGLGMLRVFEDAFIDAACARTLSVDAWAKPLRLGVDVARSGADETVGMAVRGGVCRVVFSGFGWDTMRTAGVVAQHVTGASVATGSRAIVDETGVGGGVVDRLREMRAPVTGFVSASRAREPQRYANARAEAYFALQRLLTDGGIDLDPGDRALVTQLREVRWTLDRLGRLLIEGKDAMRARGVSSPDRADALVMALYHDHIAPAPVKRISYLAGQEEPVIHRSGLVLRGERYLDVVRGTSRRVPPPGFQPVRGARR